MSCRTKRLEKLCSGRGKGYSIDTRLFKGILPTCEGTGDKAELKFSYLNMNCVSIGQIELKLFREAQYDIILASSKCGESKDLKALEVEFLKAFGHPVRPKPSDFKILEGLGEGNFSKIFKVEYKPTKSIYAFKVRQIILTMRVVLI